MAVTANQVIKRRGRDGKIKKIPVAASTILYEGTMAFEDAGGDFTGTVLENGTFGGIVRDTVDNSSGADGDKWAEVWTDGEFLLEFDTTSVVKSDAGKVVAGVDNFTVSETLTDRPHVGIITEMVTTSTAWVEIKGLGESHTGDLVT